MSNGQETGICGYRFSARFVCLMAVDMCPCGICGRRKVQRLFPGCFLSKGGIDQSMVIDSLGQFSGFFQNIL